MLARFLHIGKKTDDYENHRSKPYRETTCGAGVPDALRLTGFHAGQMPDRTVQGGWPVIEKNRGYAFYVGTQSQPLGKPIPGKGFRRTSEQAGTGSQAHHGTVRRAGGEGRHRERQAKCHEGEGKMAGSNREESVPRYLQEFFISLGARFGRIRKTPKGTPSPQLYEYKKEKLQELERQYREGRIDLYFGDGSFTCTEGYVPYGWKFPGEDVSIPSDRSARLNIWGMIDYDSRYHGFCSTESMTSESIADFLDKFSLNIKKETVIVLDNAKVHRSRYMQERRSIWEGRGLYLFFLPPYSPQLNIAEILWKMLKGHWIQPADYVSVDNLFYAVNRALAVLGTIHRINFSKRA